MQIVPVIDLMGGIVVHARRGERADYQPIVTPLAASADPVAVARGLMGVHPFQALYVADLDAIAGRGDNRAALARLRTALPEVRLWLDDGTSELAAATAWLAKDGGDLVIGSETQRDGALLRALRDDGRAILSLDFRGEAFQGPPELLADPSCWPQRVIVMTLARVGSGAGPDVARLGSIIERVEKRAVFAAGGVRDVEDLQTLRAIGCAGALVASALHNGRLTADQLLKLTAIALQ